MVLGEINQICIHYTDLAERERERNVSSDSMKKRKIETGKIFQAKRCNIRKWLTHSASSTYSV